jgi:hypothetical protein
MPRDETLQRQKQVLMVQESVLMLQNWVLLLHKSVLMLQNWVLVKATFARKTPILGLFSPS